MLQMDIESPTRMSALGDNSVAGKSAMSSMGPDMSRLPTAESGGRLNTGIFSETIH